MGKFIDQTSLHVVECVKARATPGNLLTPPEEALPPVKKDRLNLMQVVTLPLKRL